MQSPILAAVAGTPSVAGLEANVCGLGCGRKSAAAAHRGDGRGGRRGDHNEWRGWFSLSLVRWNATAKAAVNAADPTERNELGSCAGARRRRALVCRL